jgi:hypothetical protein
MDPGDESFLPFASFDFLRSLCDENGRPLGEVKAPACAVPTELVACDYADSRSAGGLPMNVSALLQIFAHWRIVLGRIRRMRPCAWPDFAV